MSAKPKATRTCNPISQNRKIPCSYRKKKCRSGSTLEIEVIEDDATLGEEEDEEEAAEEDVERDEEEEEDNLNRIRSEHADRCPRKIND